MSKIKNGGLDQYGAGPFEQQQFGIAGVEGVNSRYELPGSSSSLARRQTSAIGLNISSTGAEPLTWTDTYRLHENFTVTLWRTFVDKRQSHHANQNYSSVKRRHQHDVSTQYRCWLIITIFPHRFLYSDDVGCRSRPSLGYAAELILAHGAKWCRLSPGSSGTAQPGTGRNLWPEPSITAQCKSPDVR